jgi:hypothetical protein
MTAASDFIGTSPEVEVRDGKRLTAFDQAAKVTEARTPPQAGAVQSPWASCASDLLPEQT